MLLGVCGKDSTTAGMDSLCVGSAGCVSKDEGDGMVGIGVPWLPLLPLLQLLACGEALEAEFSAKFLCAACTLSGCWDEMLG